jgi:hypothetical protein
LKNKVVRIAGPINNDMPRMYVRGPAEVMVEGDKFDIDYEPKTTA